MIARHTALAVVLPLLVACMAPVTKTTTIVTGAIEPRHFQFVTVVKQTGNEPGGWRAACVYINIKRDNDDGPFSIPLAQRISAERANDAAHLVFGVATPESGLGLLCEAFKKTFGTLLDASIRGSRVKTTCHEKTTPVQFGESIP